MELERHPALYFDDGDIILSTYATPTSRQLFRVHRVFLSHYSEVFRGMFAVVSATNVEDTYEGLPLVKMPDDDTAEAVASLLDVMYNSSSLLRQLTTPHQSEVPFKQMGLVRIAKKYMVQDIASVVIEHVKSKWPSNLKAYDRLQEEFGSMAKADPNEKHPELFFPEPASAIAFALEHGIQCILAPAFMALSAIDANDDWDKFRQWDNPDREMPARWSLLDRQALFRLLMRRDILVSALKSALQEVETMWDFGIGEGDFTCSKTRGSCAMASRELAKDVFEVAMKEEGSGAIDCFRVLNEVAEQFLKDESLCKTCCEGMSCMVKERREGIWLKHVTTLGYL